MSLKLFYCYAHEDKLLRDVLAKHLGTLRKQGLVTDWHDRDINAGQEWAKEIDAHLNLADVILLLISPDFVHSDYCYSIEMNRALERHENGTAKVIPIILRPGDYEGAPFSQLQALPTDAIPITDRKWHSLDETFLSVAQGIRKAVGDLQSNAIDTSLLSIREKYLHSKSEQKEAIIRTELEREIAVHNVSDSSKIRTGNRIERLYLIEKLLQQHQKLRTPELAEKLGVSDDTVIRDLNFLSSTGRLPLIKEGRYWKLVKEIVNKHFDEKPISVEVVKHYEYDVALSYASEDRGYADALATILLREGVKVFYDKYEKAMLWGQDLYAYLSDIYQNKARYCVMFLSQYYAAKLWTSHERQAAQARAFKEQSGYILPVRLDETEVPGMLPTIAYLSWHQETVASIAHIILEKLENEPRMSKQQWIDESHRLYDKGYHERALIASERAVRMDPYDSGVHYDNGCMLERLRRYEEALAEFEQASKLYPDDDRHYIYDVYCNKGDVLAKLERHEEAKQAYEMARRYNDSL